jgi:hypothetical protein
MRIASLGTERLIGLLLAVFAVAELYSASHLAVNEVRNRPRGLEETE